MTNPTKSKNYKPRIARDLDRPATREINGTIRMDEDLYLALQTFMQKRGLHKAEVVRLALRKFLSQHGYYDY